MDEFYGKITVAGHPFSLDRVVKFTGVEGRMAMGLGFQVMGSDYEIIRDKGGILRSQWTHHSGEGISCYTIPCTALEIAQLKIDGFIE